ncbi:MAG: hypothetical protein AB1806_09925 [Acidobacteriota bacterium]
MSMWLQFFRASVAFGLVAGLLATPVGLAHPGAMQHDACDHLSAPAAGSEGGRLAAARRATSRGHCFTCHWFQAFRTSFTSGPRVTIDDTPAARTPAAVFQTRHVLDARLPVTRAPPRV